MVRNNGRRNEGLKEVEEEKEEEEEQELGRARVRKHGSREREKDAGGEERRGRTASTEEQRG